MFGILRQQHRLSRVIGAATCRAGTSPTGAGSTERQAWIFLFQVSRNVFFWRPANVAHSTWILRINIPPCWSWIHSSFLFTNTQILPMISKLICKYLFTEKHDFTTSPRKQQCRSFHAVPDMTLIVGRAAWAHFPPRFFEDLFRGAPRSCGTLRAVARSQQATAAPPVPWWSDGCTAAAGDLLEKTATRFFLNLILIKCC